MIFDPLELLVVVWSGLLRPNHEETRIQTLRLLLQLFLFLLYFICLVIIYPVVLVVLITMITLVVIVIVIVVVTVVGIVIFLFSGEKDGYCLKEDNAFVILRVFFNIFLHI